VKEQCEEGGGAYKTPFREQMVRGARIMLKYLRFDVDGAEER
jgi:hypothetical protein